MLTHAPLLGAMLAAGCTVSKGVNSTPSPVNAVTRATITKLEAERIVLQQFKDPSHIGIVGTTLYEDEGTWYVLVERLPAGPGAHTGYKVRATDGAIVCTVPGA
jgi:hypothetical protein